VIIVSWLIALVLEFFMVGFQFTGLNLKQQLKNSRSRELLFFVLKCETVELAVKIYPGAYNLARSPVGFVK